ncbi:transposable element Tcb1 transposase [Trichonephila clavipes]|nr:transposable element Tcb1 transposase [Trichonephila clavipes]
MWVAEWNEVVFTDESPICLHHHDSRIRIWRHCGERMLNSCVIHRHTGPAPGIMAGSLCGSFADRKHVVHGCSMIDPDYTPLPHQINLGNVWELLGLLYPKNSPKVSMN